MNPEALTPEATPARLRELSADMRAVVLLDAGGRPVASSEGSGQGDRTELLGRLAADLLLAVDRAADEPPAELEAQVAGGAVFAVRGRLFTLVAVGRRSALSALARYDMRAVLGALEDGIPIRVAAEGR